MELPSFIPLCASPLLRGAMALRGAACALLPLLLLLVHTTTASHIGVLASVFSSVNPDQFVGDNKNCPAEYTKVYTFGDVVSKGIQCLVCQTQCEEMEHFLNLELQGSEHRKQVLAPCSDYKPPPFMQILFPTTTTGGFDDSTLSFWQESCCLATKRMLQAWGYSLEEWASKLKCDVAFKDRRTQCIQPKCNEVFEECSTLWNRFSDQQRLMEKEANRQQHLRQCEICMRAMSLLKSNVNKEDRWKRGPCDEEYLPKSEDTQTRILTGYLCDEVAKKIYMCDISDEVFMIKKEEELCIGCMDLCTPEEIESIQNTDRFHESPDLEGPSEPGEPDESSEGANTETNTETTEANTETNTETTEANTEAQTNTETTEANTEAQTNTETTEANTEAQTNMETDNNHAALNAQQEGEGLSAFAQKQESKEAKKQTGTASLSQQRDAPSVVRDPTAVRQDDPPLIRAARERLCELLQKENPTPEEQSEIQELRRSIAESDAVIHV